MKYYALIFAIAALTSCEQKKTEQVQTGEQSAVINQKDGEIDSLKSVINANSNTSTHQSPSVSPENDAESGNQQNGTENTPVNTGDLSGKHSLTLQWISWDQPGVISFKKTGSDTYQVAGKQKIKEQYVTVDGKVTQISKEELLFEGTIVTNTTLDGKCVKTGKQTFLSTKGRKYWRLQNMENCAGATDYVDIYF